nr:type I restriction endonuclease [uncultured Nevskia sp.]
MTGSLSEDDISVKFITPALHKAGWDETVQIRRQVSFNKGRIMVRGRLVARDKPKRADFVLYYRHIPMALIGAKRGTFSKVHSMQQAPDYASSLDIPFVFASNGKGFVFQDKTAQIEVLETSLALDVLQHIPPMSRAVAD